jgi:PPOX class probable F420-dependent enzyme
LVLGTLGIALSPQAQALVAQPLIAVIGTRRADGSVQMNPAWFEYRDGYFWVNSHTRRSWPQNVLRERTVSLVVVDREDPFRWVRVDGRLVEASTAGAAEHIDRLARRYTGKPFRPLEPNEQRIMFKIEAVKIAGEKI